MSMFNKRHYEAIAELMQSIGETPSESDSPAKAMWRDTITALGDMFARDNGLFKRDRFERACVPGANVKART